MMQANDDYDLLLQKLTDELAVKEAVLTALVDELQTAADAITPLAHGDHISQAAQIALAGMVNISINRALSLIHDDHIKKKAPTHKKRSKKLLN